MPTGLVDSFLQAFSQASELHRQREQDKKAAIQQSVENAFRQHAQEQEAERIKLEGEAQKQRAKYEVDQLNIQRQAQERLTKKDLEEADYHRNTFRLGLQKLGASQQKDILDQRTKLVAELSKTYDPLSAEREADRIMGTYLQGAYPAEGTAPAAPQPQGINGPLGIGRIGQPAQGAVQGAAPAPAQPFGAPQQPEMNPLAAARIKHLNALSEHTVETTKQLHELDDINKKYKQAQIEHVIAQTMREKKATELLPKQFEEKKWYDQNRLQIDKIRAEADKLRAAVAQQGPNSRAAIQEAQQSAIGLRQYAAEARKEVQAAKKAETEASSATSYAGNLIKKLKGKSDLTPAEQDMLIRAQAVWEENTTKDSSGNTRLGQLTKDRKEAEAELNRANAAAISMEGVYQKPVTPSGGIRPMGLTPSMLRSLEDSEKRNTQRRKEQPKTGSLPRVRSVAEARKLKPGTHFLDPNGVERIR